MPRPRVALSALTALALLPGGIVLSETSSAAASSSPVAAPAADEQDIKSRIEGVPGVVSVEDASDTVPAQYRFFRIGFEQPVDHRDPSKGTFVQRITLLHKDISRPMVMYTSGYGVSSRAGRAEPTQIVDGNQLSMEYRFFNASRPADPDWEQQLTIWQAATDQHRIIEAFRSIYDQNWLTTGGSKGGMTATYHRRFYPDDVDGSIPYVAPNDVRDHQDVYNRFLSQVGSDPDCRAAITAVQRKVLGPERAWFLDRVAKDDAESGNTYTIVGSREKAVESSVVDAYFAFWQYQPEWACAGIPKAATATNEQIYDWFGSIHVPLNGYADQSVGGYTPYYFQAAYQLGSPEPFEDNLRDLLKFPGANVARTFVPDALKPSTFDREAMPDIDRWVRKSSTQMLYVDGQNDPWSAEPFNCGPSGWKRACHRYVVPGGNHGSSISQLPTEEKEHATDLVLQWAGLEPSDPAVQHLRIKGKPKSMGEMDKRGQQERMPRVPRG